MLSQRALVKVVRLATCNHDLRGMSKSYKSLSRVAVFPSCAAWPYSAYAATRKTWSLITVIVALVIICIHLLIIFVLTCHGIFLVPSQTLFQLVTYLLLFFEVISGWIGSDCSVWRYELRWIRYMLALKVGESRVAQNVKLVRSYMASKGLQQRHLVLLLDCYWRIRSAFKMMANCSPC